MVDSGQAAFGNMGYEYLLDRTFSNILVPGPFSKLLNSGQKATLEDIVNDLDGIVYRRQPLSYGYNVLGSAGSGKTFLQSALLEQCVARRIGLISMVYTGMGSTLCFCLSPEGEIFQSETYNKTMSVSYFSKVHKILDIKDLSEKSIQEKLNGLWKDKTYVVVSDECSIYTDHNFQVIQNRLHQLTKHLETDLSSPFLNFSKSCFGRFLAIFVGDIKQLPPPGGEV